MKKLLFLLMVSGPPLSANAGIVFVLEDPTTISIQSDPIDREEPQQAFFFAVGSGGLVVDAGTMLYTGSLSSITDFTGDPDLTALVEAVIEEAPTRIDFIEIFDGTATPPPVVGKLVTYKLLNQCPGLVYLLTEDTLEVFSPVWIPGSESLAFFPRAYSTYDYWVAMGCPACWCWPPSGSGYQCDGDVDGATETEFGYRVYAKDLALVIENWKKKIDDPTLNPCADIDHKPETLFNFRVYGKDLATVVTNWKKKDTDLPGDCPRPE